MTSLDRCHLSPSVDINDWQGIKNRGYDSLGLKTFDYTEHKLQDMENDIDPEKIIYHNMHNPCEYYAEEQLNGMWNG